MLESSELEAVGYEMSSESKGPTMPKAKPKTKIGEPFIVLSTIPELSTCRVDFEVPQVEYEVMNKSILPRVRSPQSYGSDPSDFLCQSTAYRMLYWQAVFRWSIFSVKKKTYLCKKY